MTCFLEERKYGKFHRFSRGWCPWGPWRFFSRVKFSVIRQILYKLPTFYRCQILLIISVIKDIIENYRKHCYTGNKRNNCSEKRIRHFVVAQSSFRLGLSAFMQRMSRFASEILLPLMRLQRSKHWIKQHTTKAASSSSANVLTRLITSLTLLSRFNRFFF